MQSESVLPEWTIREFKICNVGIIVDSVPRTWSPMGTQMWSVCDVCAGGTPELLQSRASVPLHRMAGSRRARDHAIAHSVRANRERLHQPDALLWSHCRALQVNIITALPSSMNPPHPKCINAGGVSVSLCFCGTVLEWAAPGPSSLWTESFSSWTPETRWTSTVLCSIWGFIAHTWCRRRWGTQHIRVTLYSHGKSSNTCQLTLKSNVFVKLVPVLVPLSVCARRASGQKTAQWTGKPLVSHLWKCASGSAQRSVCCWCVCDEQVFSDV